MKVMRSFVAVICILLFVVVAVDATERNHHHQHSHHHHSQHHSQHHSHSSETQDVPDCSGVHLPLLKSPYPKEKTKEFVILHYNDVYEMTNMARLATVSYCLRKAYIAEYGESFENMMIMFGGDIISFCAFNDVEEGGKKYNGKQLIELMNFMAKDYKYKFATFGNHEFDYDSYEALQEALEMSDFQWVSTSVGLVDQKGKKWSDKARSKVTNYISTKIGGMNFFISGITIDKTKRKYVNLLDIETAISFFKSHLDTEVKTKSAVFEAVDVVLALNHLGQNEDMRVALSIPDIDLIVGGHDHKNAVFYRGLSKNMNGLYNTPISRADLNANSIFIHQIFIQTDASGQSGQSLKPTMKVVRSSYMAIDNRIVGHPDAESKIEGYKNTALKFYRAKGLVPATEDLNTKLIELQQGWNGMEDRLKFPGSRLATWACNSMFEYTVQHRTEFQATSTHGRASYQLNYALFPALTIRMDDFFGPGDVTWLDLLRLLPRGVEFVVMRFKASAWAKVVAYFKKTAGKEAYTFPCQGFQPKRSSSHELVYVVMPEFVRGIIYNEFGKKPKPEGFIMAAKCGEVLKTSDVECLGNIESSRYPMVKAAKENLHNLEAHLQKPASAVPVEVAPDLSTAKPTTKEGEAVKMKVVEATSGEEKKSSPTAARRWTRANSFVKQQLTERKNAREKLEKEYDLSEIFFQRYLDGGKVPEASYDF